MKDADLVCCFDLEETAVMTAAVTAALSARSTVLQPVLSPLSSPHITDLQHTGNKYKERLDYKYFI